MAKLSKKIKVMKLISNYFVDIKLVGVKRYKIRMFFALLLIRFSVWILNMKCRIELNENN